jgi:putative ABC transport system substrate-binding protein
MRRREFITVLGGVVGWPIAARAQKSGLSVVGFLTNVRENSVKAFTQALAQLGWTEGKNVRIETRSAEGKPFAPLVADLVRLMPDVIVANSTPSLAALRQATSTIPIVFANVTDPVGQGFVTSLARPGANITGFMNFESSIGGKWVEMLREISPGLSRVAVVFNPELGPQTEYFVPVIEKVARELSLKPIITRIHDEPELDRALAALGGEPQPGMIVPPGVYTPTFRMKIIEAMDHYRVPAIYWSRTYVTEGGLVAYGTDETDLYRRAASYVDRLLKGVKPADLPVQAPTKFQLAINLKTARSLGLAIPPNFLATADEVIE